MNTITNFISNNSSVLTTLGIIIVGIISALIAKDRQRVYTGIYSLVSEAQSLDATNPEKFTYVLDTAYGELPRVIKLFVSEDNVKRAITFSLSKFKEYASVQMVPGTSVIVSPVEVKPDTVQAPNEIAAEIKTETEVITPVETNEVTAPIEETIAIPVETVSEPVSATTVESGMVPETPVAPILPVVDVASAISKIQDILATIAPVQ
ncbi:hypothetical protein G9F71_008180 [Clostridium sp. FP2]|uniref:hypothetical protein n=1 Tax=Clostridium sp. FP2 TaxID=2724481 RepID=UPI0013E93DFD|nr:hypothetical protein [Clostridium sp. FP2]MBZ9622828.1 hypothetical protein [Clostridium sp. FP2]